LEQLVWDNARDVPGSIEPASRMAVGVVCALAVCASPRSESDSPAAETHAFRYVMGTSVQVQAFGGDTATRQQAIEEAFAAISEVDRLMSNYRSDSELTHLNASAAKNAVEVRDPMLRVLEAARAISDASGGAFDVTVGPLAKLWGFFDKRPHVPTDAELAAVRPLVDYRNVRIDAAAHTVAFARPGIEIDLGGIAKGFAVEVAAGVLRRRGLAGFIDAGGNQYMVGLPPGKRQWTVGVKDPETPGGLLGAIDLAEGSVSTSANDSNFLVADGRRYGHILDPHTLKPSPASESATIVSLDGTLADAMSKAAFVLGPRLGIALIDATPDMAGVIAYRKADGSIAIAMSRRLVGKFHPARSLSERSPSLAARGVLPIVKNPHNYGLSTQTHELGAGDRRLNSENDR
jgi:FAD:protein FMN transferase